MLLIITIIIGALAGWFASMIMKTDNKQGLFLDIVVGIIGSSIGHWVFNKFSIHLFNNGGFIDNLIVATIGACILLGLIKLFQSLFSSKSR